MADLTSHNDTQHSLESSAVIKRDASHGVDALGLRDMGTHPEMMVKAPFKMPAVPNPAMALPPINILDELEMAQIREPISKTKKKPINVHCQYVQCDYSP